MRHRREKLTATEAKLKAAVQDKTNAGIEKAALERELKGLRGQAGRLTKVQDSPRPMGTWCSGNVPREPSHSVLQLAYIAMNTCRRGALD